MLKTEINLTSQELNFIWIFPTRFLHILEQLLDFDVTSLLQIMELYFKFIRIQKIPPPHFPMLRVLFNAGAVS